MHDLKETLKALRDGVKIYDIDGTLVKVRNVDPKDIVLNVPVQVALVGQAKRNSNSIVILTGRSQLAEVFTILAGRGALPEIFKSIPIMTGHGFDLSYDGKNFSTPVPETERVAVERARSTGEAYNSIKKRFAYDGDLSDFLSKIYVTPQQNGLNINISQVDPAYKDGVVECVNRFLERTRFNFFVKPEKIGQMFFDDLDCVCRDVALPPVSPKIMYFNDRAHKHQKLKVVSDTDKTYMELQCTSNKGDNLVHWLRALPIAEGDAKIVILADHLQAGGGDRKIADALIRAGYGDRLVLIQSLDGLNKKPIAKSDPLYKYAGIVVADPEALGRLIEQVEGPSSLQETADKIRAWKVEGVMPADFLDVGRSVGLAPIPSPS